MVIFFFTSKIYFLFMECPFYKASYTYFMDLINFTTFLRILTILICFHLVSLYCLFSLSSFLKFLGFGFSHSCKNLSSKLHEHSCPFIIKNEALQTARILQFLLFSILSFCNCFCFQYEAVGLVWKPFIFFSQNKFSTYFLERCNYLITLDL